MKLDCLALMQVLATGIKAGPMHLNIGMTGEKNLIWPPDIRSKPTQEFALKFVPLLVINCLSTFKAKKPY